MKFTVYKDDEQWIPFFKWFWQRAGESGMGHGGYPAKWIAWLSGWFHTRNDGRTTAEVEAEEKAKQQQGSEELTHQVEELEKEGK